MEYYQKSVTDVLTSHATSLSGLSPADAHKRLTQHGENKLKEEHKTSALIILIRQFADLVVYILLGAVAISFFVGEYLDAFVILAILIFNALLGFFQEYKAERSIELLRKLTELKVKVIRDGELQEILSSLIVPGDIIVLEAGDRVCADTRIIEAKNLQTDESSLTGESIPCTKQIAALSGVVDLAERANMLYSGTSVVRGTGKGVVVGTGMHTEIGKIAEMVQHIKQTPTPLQVKLKELGKTLGFLVFAVCVSVFLIGILRNLNTVETLLTAVSLAVAAVPEGLPAVVTICLALSVQHMIRRNALIKRLKSIETLGSVTVICSDKTGTLTTNEMTVKKLYVNQTLVDVGGEGYNSLGSFSIEGKAVEPQSFKLLLDIAASCNNSTKDIGDPTERALLFAALKGDVTTKRNRIDEIPFDSDKKYMATMHEKGVTYYKGAPEVILGMCHSIIINGKRRRLIQRDMQKILTINHQMADDALRVLAMAFSYKHEMCFVGLMGMIDPPKEGVKEALTIAETAGITSIMITGDHPRTAAAIATQIGLHGDVLSGHELSEMSDDDLKHKVKKYTIFARATSEHKVRILEALQRNGEVVAMTGDGVNDAPALKKADVGIAMSLKGTNVTRDAADMVLTDDHYSSIVSAVEEGRTVYDNIKKFVNYLLSANAVEVGVILIGLLIGLPLPLLPLHILWMNLMTDSWPALALSTDRPDSNMMRRPPRDPNESLFKNLKGQMLFTALFGTGIILTLFAVTNNLYGVEKARSITLTALILFEICKAFTCKTREPFKGIFTNTWLNLAALFSLALQILIIYTPLHTLFSLVPLSINDWVWVALVGSTGYFVLELYKLILTPREQYI